MRLFFPTPTIGTVDMYVLYRKYITSRDFFANIDYFVFRMEFVELLSGRHYSADHST